MERIAAVMDHVLQKDSEVMVAVAKCEWSHQPKEPASSAAHSVVAFNTVIEHQTCQRRIVKLQKKIAGKDGKLFEMSSKLRATGQVVVTWVYACAATSDFAGYAFARRN